MTPRGKLLLTLAGAAAVILIWRSHDPNAPRQNPPNSACKAVTFESSRFTECVAVPGKHRISMRITGSDGVIYRGFFNLRRDLPGKSPGNSVAFAMNGGMYDASSQPIGYYAENGNRLYPLNQRDADGNFYLKPNGVFFGDAAGNWRVMSSEDFAAQITTRPEFGTQSGPMLLRGGRLHPKISPNGTSAKIRNAVGVDPQGRAHFVISDDPVTFGRLARFLQNHAHANDALFFDGEVSALWDPASDRLDARYPLGPLILVENVTKSAAKGPAK